MGASKIADNKGETMSDEYTPTTDQVRGEYVHGRYNVGVGVEAGEVRPEFDRWLAAHDADLTDGLVAAEATISQIATVLANDYELGLRAGGVSQVEALFLQRRNAQLLASTYRAAKS